MIWPIFALIFISFSIRAESYRVIDSFFCPPQKSEIVPLRAQINTFTHPGDKTTVVRVESSGKYCFKLRTSQARTRMISEVIKRQLPQTVIGPIGIHSVISYKKFLNEETEEVYSQIPEIKLDWRMVDQNDHAHLLTYYTDYDYVILVALPILCKEKLRKFSELAPLLKRLDNQKKAKVFFVDSSDASREQIKEAAGSAFEGITLVVDDTKMISHDLGLESAEDFIIYRTKPLGILVKGNHLSSSCLEQLFKANSIDKKKCKKEGEGFFLKTLSQWSSSCEMKSPDESKVSYQSQVVPIISNKCLRCHLWENTGAFTSYEKLVAWSPMLRQTIVTKRMPLGGARQLLRRFRRQLLLRGGSTHFKVDRSRLQDRWIIGSAGKNFTGAA